MNKADIDRFFEVSGKVRDVHRDAIDARHEAKSSPTPGTHIGAKVGGAIGAAVGGPPGALIGIVAGGVGGAVYDWWNRH